jgi:hypothetical protein
LAGGRENISWKNQSFSLDPIGCRKALALAIVYPKPSTYFFLFLVAAAFLAMYWFSVNVPFRTGSLLRRNGPVPSIQSSEPAGAILDKSEAVVLEH